MNTIAEVWRHTFPKNLRYDKASQIFYAQCLSVSKRYKHRKYIPVEEVQQVLDSYTPLPGKPYLQYPIIRHILFIRLIDSVRQRQGMKGWLYNRNIEREHMKVQEWVERETLSTAGKSSAAGGLRGMIMRERFNRELLGSMHIATAYHRLVRLGFGVIGILVVILIATLQTDRLLYLYLHKIQGLGRAEVMAWMREVTHRHADANVPEAYGHLLPVPCELYTMKNGERGYRVNILELVSTERGVTVIAVPCPQMGEVSFFEQVGRVLAACDTVLMEGVSLEQIDCISPAMFLPLKEVTFPALGMHHRFLDIMRVSNEEPPKLYPAANAKGFRVRFWQTITPLEVQCVYNPTSFSATRAEARSCWGRLLSVVEEHSTSFASSAPADVKGQYVIGVPWTVAQIANIEASLIKLGFEVKSVFPVHWVAADQIGDSFCNFYRIT